MPEQGALQSIPVEVLRMLAGVSTATLTMLLLKRGIRSAFMAGVRPLVADGPRLVAVAETWRFVPMREDVSTVESLGGSGNSREAIEAAPVGSVIVADARGGTNAGVLGDILAARLVRRGIAGLVTDGAVRDMAGVVATGLPVFCVGAAAPPTIGAIHFAGRGQMIGCGGVMVRPGDLIVGDGDGVVVVPVEMADEIARDGIEQEAFEAFVLDEVRLGRPLSGLYPPDSETKARFAAHRSGRTT